jgi:hypothetical protein
MNEEKTGKCLRQVEYIRGHLWHIYSIADNRKTLIKMVSCIPDCFPIYKLLVILFSVWYEVFFRKPKIECITFDDTIKPFCTENMLYVLVEPISFFFNIFKYIVIFFHRLIYGQRSCSFYDTNYLLVAL